MHTDRCGNTRGQKNRSKGNGKKPKYKSLCIDIQRMWNMECMIIPVTIRATGIATKGLKKYLKAMLEKYSINSLQKTLLFRTSYIKRKVLQSEIGSLSGGDRLWSKRSTGKKRPVTIENNSIIIIIIIIIRYGCLLSQAFSSWYFS